MTDKITDIFHQFSSKKVLIVGDVMVDEYYVGNVTRISPEAPVPVVSVTSRERRLGGAANVALNIDALGAQPIMCSIRGNDVEGEWLFQRFEELGFDNEGIIIDYQRPTTIKTRIIGNKHQILRVDQEDCAEVSPTIEKQVIDFLKKRIPEVDVVIFQDYNKGLLTKKIITQGIKLCNTHGVPSLVDPKKDHFLDYKEVSLFKPNKKEIIDGLKLSGALNTKDEIETAMVMLATKLQAKTILLTLSEMGVAVLDEGKVSFFDAHPRNIVDVSGAGDSVISVASLALACQLDKSLVAQLSNLAGGLVCENVGVVAVDSVRLLAEAQRILG